MQWTRSYLRWMPSLRILKQLKSIKQLHFHVILIHFLIKKKIIRKKNVWSVFFFNMNTVMTNGDDNGIRRVWCGDTLSTKTQHGFASYLRKHHLRLLKVRLMKVVFWVHSRTHQLLFLFSYLIWTWCASGWLITRINESKLIFISDLNS